MSFIIGQMALTLVVVAQAWRASRLRWVSPPPSIRANENTNCKPQQALVNNSMNDFVIIEYQDRIGGRAINTDFGRQEDGSPYKVEVGANWVRGTRHTQDCLTNLACNIDSGSWCTGWPR